MQRVNEASFFEADNFKKLRGRQWVLQCYVWPGWWGNNILLSISVRFLVSTFESFLGFREFPPVSRPFFFNRAREREVKLRHVVYEFWLGIYLFFSFQIWYFVKWIISSIGQSKHMRVTRFNPLWVSYNIQWKLRQNIPKIHGGGSSSMRIKTPSTSSTCTNNTFVTNELFSFGAA